MSNTSSENTVKNSKEIDLRGESFLNKKIKKQTEKVYDLVDDEIRKITLDGDIVIKLISNSKGLFVDFRKYFKGYPTKKGIRIAALKFKEVYSLLEGDIKKLIPDANSLADLDDIINK